MIRAAFIGVDKHLASDIRDLNGAARDAQGLWSMFSDSIPGIDAKLLINEDATLKASTEAIEYTLGNAGADDIVVLGFAGHGTTDHRLVFHDTETDRLGETALDMGTLAARFRETHATRVLVLLDCCFSGGAPARVLDVGVAERDLGIPLEEIAGKGRLLFAASSQNQSALEDPQSRRGLFTGALMDCLFEQDGPMSVLALVDDVSRRVRVAAGSLGYEQTPEIFGHIEGELILPRMSKGNRYQATFPEYVSVQTEGDFIDLAAANISNEVLDAWDERYDLTGATEKKIYKRHMRYLESAFYKYEVLDGHWE